MYSASTSVPFRNSLPSIRWRLTSNPYVLVLMLPLAFPRVVHYGWSPPALPFARFSKCSCLRKVRHALWSGRAKHGSGMGARATVPPPLPCCGIARFNKGSQCEVPAFPQTHSHRKPRHRQLGGRLVLLLLLPTPAASASRTTVGLRDAPQQPPSTAPILPATLSTSGEPTEASGNPATQLP